MKKTENEPYWEMVLEHYEHILRLYEQFAEKHPVMLFDVQEQRIYAYPYREFKADLSPRSQKILARAYQAALKSDHFVVFVRDSEARKFVSFTVDPSQMVCEP